ncbi:unnamed protein product [Enterobius vermicularis]|uniref:VWFA domain-containing protein n=1 Tax=Enterobius vermicularis TaxID=51028 RepID=A0A0N4VHX3_ENTVE|nr:unnamed protein product [Enterobius vermicularis]
MEVSHEPKELYTHNSPLCGCDNNKLKGVWADVVIVMDTSAVDDSAATIRSFLIALVNATNIGQGEGQHSRIGIINGGSKATIFANLTKYQNTREATEDIKKLPMLGGSIFRADLALEAAKEVFDIEVANGRRTHFKKIVILFSTRGFDCAKSKSLKMKVDEDYACRIASHMKSSGITIITVARKVSSTDYPSIDLGTPCYKMNQDNDYAANIVNLLCKANCYCEPDFSLVTNEDDCNQIYSECVYFSIAQMNYDSARNHCISMGAGLSNVFSKEKDKFLYGVVQTSCKMFPNFHNKENRHFCRLTAPAR